MPSFMPKVMGSAWMPCVRPTCTVSRNSTVRRLSTCPQRDEVALQQVPGAPDLQRHARVQHVAARHAVVHVLAGVAHVLGHVGEEGDDVVVGGGLDLGDAVRRRRPRLRDDLLERVVGDLAEPVPGLHGGDLDVRARPACGPLPSTRRPSREVCSARSWHALRVVCRDSLTSGHGPGRRRAARRPFEARRDRARRSMMPTPEDEERASR